MTKVTKVPVLEVLGVFEVLEIPLPAAESEVALKSINQRITKSLYHKITK